MECGVVGDVRPWELKGFEARVFTKKTLIGLGVLWLRCKNMECSVTVGSVTLMFCLWPVN